MKLLYFLIFTTNLVVAQNPDLLNTKWQITKIVGELLPGNLYAPSMPYQQSTTFSTSPPQLSISFFNNVSANLTFSGDNMFSVNNKSCTSGDYMDDNGQVNQFFGLLCSFFNVGNGHYYSIQDNGNEKTLIISNSIFQEIHFKSANLSAKENEFAKINMYPNPATDYIIVDNLKPNSSLELLDSSGKLVKTISSIKFDRTELNIKNLPSGIYYLKVDGQPIQKIIKK